MNKLMTDHLETIRKFIDCIEDQVFVMEVGKGPVYRYAILNNKAKSHLQETDEVIGKEMGEVVYPEKARFLSEQYRQVLVNKEKVIYEYSDRENRYEETSLNPFFDEGGEVIFIIAVTRDISERKQLEKQLILNELKYKSMVDNNSDSVYMLDLEGRFLSLNKAGERLSGYKESELLHTHFKNVVSKEDFQTAQKFFETALLGRSEEFNLHVFDKSGKAVYCRVKNIPITVEGRLIGIFGIAKDITVEHEMNEVIKRNEAYYRTLTDQAPDPVAVIQEGYIQYTNHAFAALIDVSSRERSFGKPLKDFLPFYNRGTVQEKFADILKGTENKDPIEEKIITFSGKTKEVEIYATSTTFKEKTAIHAVLRDITARKETERKVNKMAFYDYLTDLPNRQLFEANIERAIEKAATDHASFALLFIDGDKFKEVNDTIGHQGGDAFLKEFANRLQKSIRNGDTVGRIGGDEFSILLPDIKNEQEVITVIDRASHHLQQPWEYDGQSMNMTMSVGIAIFPRDGEDEGTLVRKADEALYMAKASGRNTYKFYHSIDSLDHY